MTAIAPDPAQHTVDGIVRVADDAHTRYLGDLIALGLFTEEQYRAAARAWEAQRPLFYRLTNDAVPRGDL